MRPTSSASSTSPLPRHVTSRLVFACEPTLRERRASENKFADHSLSPRVEHRRSVSIEPERVRDSVPKPRSRRCFVCGTTGRHPLDFRVCPRTTVLLRRSFAKINDDGRLVSIDGSPLPMTRHPGGVAAHLISRFRNPMRIVPEPPNPPRAPISHTPPRPVSVEPRDHVPPLPCEFNPSSLHAIPPVDRAVPEPEHVPFQRTVSPYDHTSRVRTSIILVLLDSMLDSVFRLQLRAILAIIDSLSAQDPSTLRQRLQPSFETRFILLLSSYLEVEIIVPPTEEGGDEPLVVLPFPPVSSLSTPYSGPFIDFLLHPYTPYPADRPVISFYEHRTPFFLNDNPDATVPEAHSSGSMRKPKAKSGMGAGKRSNPIYLFYESVTCDAKRNTHEGLKLLEIAQTATPVKHLKATSLPHYQLFQVLLARSSPPTDRERALACGATELTDDIVAEYVEIGKRLDQNIKAMFEKQVVEAQLLEAIGALTKDEKKAAKSKSATSAYQDSATEALSREADEEAGQTEDSEDIEVETPESLIGTAVFKLRKIIRHVRSSPQRRRRWNEAVITASQPSTVLMLILDVKTRRSSTHQMLRRALDFRKPILNYISDYEDLTEHSLPPTEWAALTQVTKWLKSYRYATTKLSTTKQPMLSTTHAIFRWLQDELKTAIAELPATADPTLLEGLVAAHRKLSDYFTKFDESRYYSWATLLDPRLSYTGLREDYVNDPELLAGLEKSKAALEVHFKVHYANSQQPSALEAQAEHSPAGSPVKFNIFRRYGASATPTAISQNELEDYFRLTSIPEPFEDTDPLQWWQSQVLSGSAVAVERVFSGGRDTIGLRRASLKAETIEMLMFVKARLRLAREEAKTREKLLQKALEESL
ncbi:Transposase-like protein [Mycena venus]|uniref:Transposase-like protein n=1 Tax=Mycena venus TaxID=2733690 RepID=A0A8H7CME6_9AGAR|nr:Transposase-like protein [Mycena venus]